MTGTTHWVPACWAQSRIFKILLSSSMTRREIYGKKALECLLAADGMASAENRVAMLTLAQCWSRLGIRSDEIADHQMTALPSGATIQPSPRVSDATRPRA